ncbi:MAG TPA: CRISPR-associated endonuclease Cas2 [Patescibacteria group bacterium]|nr:CRISPR-associated endonuclease Cas2 [Patescibacteria group bacterium]
MARRKKVQAPKEHVTRDILLQLLKTGVVLAVAMTAPNALKMFTPRGRRESPLEQYYPSSVNRQLTRLWRKGFVDVREGPDGYVVTISDKGKTEILRYDLDTMDVPRPREWDGKWRMVFFDIPGKEESVRAAFRQHLKSMGFFQMQKSVYVHPFPCSKQVQFLREVYAIPHSVKLAVVDVLENDEDLRRIFHV